MIRSLTTDEKGTLIMGLFPPMILSSLLEDESFRKESGLESIAVVKIDDSIVFQRSLFFDAIRKAIDGNTEEIADEHGRVWKLLNYGIQGNAPLLKLTSDDVDRPLSDMSVFSAKPSIRMQYLKKIARDVGFSDTDFRRWREVLEVRSFTDDEYAVFNRDLRNTPVAVNAILKEELQASTGTVPLRIFVPNSEQYYERLVGIYEGCKTIEEYARRNGRSHFEKLSKWNPYDGFLFSLLLSSHSALTSEISVDALSVEELQRAYTYVDQQGDMLSRIGALEIGLRIHSQRPEIEQFLLPLLCRIRDDDVKDDHSEFGLFSALFILVDGTLARNRILINRPPFYRRLASLAQAAMIQRQMIHCNIGKRQLVFWSYQHAGIFFYMQSLADLRQAPKWNPDFSLPGEIQTDFLGRVLNSATENYELIHDKEIGKTISSSGDGSLISRCPLPRQYFPGPLEGDGTRSRPLSPQIANSINEMLQKKEIDAASFINLITAAMFFQIPSDQVDLAARAVSMAQHKLVNLTEKSQLRAVLRGLANVAAVSRNHNLANELRILVRVYRKDSQFQLTIEEALNVALVASASRDNLSDWTTFVGDWLTELAFSDLTIEEGKILQSSLKSLLHAVPELWVTCSRAEAALAAFCSK